MSNLTLISLFPKFEKAHRGSIIDKRARKSVENNSYLQKQGIHGKSNKGVDFTDKNGSKWDMTIKNQAQKHLDKYGDDTGILDTESYK